MSGHHILLPHGVKLQPGDEIWREREGGSRWEPADKWLNTASGYPFRRWVEAPEPPKNYEVEVLKLIFSEMVQAWEIMDEIGHHDAAALEWLQRNEQYKPTTTTTNAGE